MNGEKPKYCKEIIVTGRNNKIGLLFEKFLGQEIGFLHKDGA